MGLPLLLPVSSRPGSQPAPPCKAPRRWSATVTWEYKYAEFPKSDNGTQATVIGGENFGVCAGSEHVHGMNWKVPSSLLIQHIAKPYTPLSGSDVASQTSLNSAHIYIVPTFISREELMKQYTIGAVSGELPDIGPAKVPITIAVIVIAAASFAIFLFITLSSSFLDLYHLISTDAVPKDQIPYSVGFSDPKYFYRCFKEETDAGIWHSSPRYPD